MAIGTENAFSGPYTANGVTTEFPFTFSVLTDAQVIVMLIDADGVETEADPGDYTVTLNGTAPTDGTVVFTSAPETGYDVVPLLDMDFTQETLFVDGSAWKAGPTNNVNDRAALRDQQLKREVDRGIKVPFGEDPMRLPSVANRAGKYFGFNSATGAPDLFDSPTFASVTNQVVSTIVALAALTGPANGASAQVLESGKAGVFVYSSSNLSSSVTADPAKGLYVPPDAAPTGASGAWVRVVHPSAPFRAEWWGLPTGGSDTTIVKSIEALREDGRDVHFGAGTFLFSDIRVNKPGHWKGVGKATVISHNGANPTSYNTFGIATSGGTRISHMRFTGIHDNDNADAQFHINVSPRVNVVTTPEALEDFEFDHLFFDDSDTGIRVSFGGTGTANDVPGTTWWTPKRVWIHDCVFEDVLYQPILPEGHDIVVERCRFKLTSKPGGGYRPFGYFMRILGCNRLTVRDNYFECPYDYPMISTQMAAVDNGLSNVAIRAPRHVRIENNRFNGGFFILYHSGDQLSIKNNWFYNNPTTTTDTPPALFYLAFQQGQPIYLSNIEIHDNTGYGYPVQMLIENHSADKISYKRNEIYGNLKTGAAFDVVPIKVSVNSGVFNQDGVTQIKPPMMLDIEGNGIYSNPSMIGSFIQVVGHTTGLHVRLAGNRTSERQGSGTTLISGSALSGTDFQISLGFGTAFDAWVTVSGATDLSDNAVGDNIAMPTGYYAAALAASKFRDEQYLSTVYPATFA